uniref:Uncharacterized protein n=1 Tax=Zea mays TaxID=4577 RepID=C4IY60_MAIZE|nr:unknown [Zea mays]
MLPQTHAHNIQKNANMPSASSVVAYWRLICSNSAVQRADHHPVVDGGAPGPDGRLRPVGDLGFPAEPPPDVRLGRGSCGERRVGRAGRGGRDGGGAVGLDGERRRAGDGDAARHRRRRRRRGSQDGRRRGGGGGEGGVLAELAEAGVRSRAGHRLVPELIEEAHSGHHQTRTDAIGWLAPACLGRRMRCARVALSCHVAASEGRTREKRRRAWVGPAAVPCRAWIWSSCGWGG